MSLLLQLLTGGREGRLSQYLGKDSQQYIDLLLQAEADFFQLHQPKYDYLIFKMQLVSRLSAKQLQLLPEYKVGNKQIVLVDDHNMQQVIDNLNQANILGFDTETRASFEKGRQYPISLIQLADVNVCYLFQIEQLSDLSLLADILNNDKITKVGIGLRQDQYQLQRDLAISLRAGFDLQWLMQQLGGAKQLGTKAIVSQVLQCTLAKSKQLSLSNWQATPLTNEQQLYAALDGFVARECFMALIAQLKPYKASMEPAILRRLGCFFED